MNHPPSIAQRWYEDEKPYDQRGRLLIQEFEDHVEIDVMMPDLGGAETLGGIVWMTEQQAQEIRDWLDQYLTWRRGGDKNG